LVQNWSQQVLMQVQLATPWSHVSSLLAADWPQAWLDLQQLGQVQWVLTVWQLPALVVQHVLLAVLWLQGAPWAWQ
jgi:hypothetical protein